MHFLARPLWVCFTVVVQRARKPLHAVALVSTGAVLICLSIFLALQGTRLTVPLADVQVQAILQGILVTVILTKRADRAFDGRWR
jgi:hypothetical protein